MNQLTEANKLAKNKLAVSESNLRFVESAFADFKDRHYRSRHLEDYAGSKRMKHGHLLM